MNYKSSFSKLFQDKTVRNFTLAIAGFFLFQYFKKAENKTEVLSTSPNDPSTRIAIAVFDAFHPYVALPLGLPDGTNEEQIKLLAYEIGQLNIFTAVVQKFKIIYNQDLLNELQSEGVYAEFQTEFNKGLTVGGSTGGSSGTGGSTGGSSYFFKVNDIVSAKANYNLRVLAEPSNPLRSTKLGERLVIRQIRINKTIAGKKGTWFVVQEDSFFGSTFYISSLGVNRI
jgi:hypothetical protein